MKFPLSLLQTLVDTPRSAPEIADMLTMTGFELEELTESENEPVFDINIMANRGDAASVFGLMREYLAKDPAAKPTEHFSALASAWGKRVEGAAKRISIETSMCTRFGYVVIPNVQNGASPEWLQKWLRQMGQRPISLLVDLTNFVMLEMGHPLHAYDLDKLVGGRIIVREAKPGETLTTLNGDLHELQAGQMMICDESGPIGVAGVMGGLETEVSEITKTILLEAAHFVNTSVRKTRKHLGLHTEASYRFERSVDPEGLWVAIDRFVQLYEEITATSNSVTESGDLYPAPTFHRMATVRPARAAAVLGLECSTDEAKDCLVRLGFKVTQMSDSFEVEIPTWRPDIELEEDLIEEIGRVFGYEKIGELLPQGTTSRGGSFGLPKLVDRSCEVCLRVGLHQMISHSLRGPHLLDFRDNERIGPRNPHSPETALLRNSLLPGLCEAALKNGGRDLKIFEIGQVFVKGDVEIDESPELAILLTGKLEQPRLQTEKPPLADFWAMKGIVAELMSHLGMAVDYLPPLNADPRLHPTRQAGIVTRDARIHLGIFGEINPDVAESVGLSPQTVLAEIDLLAVYMEEPEAIRLRSFSRNPAIRRDIAFVIDKETRYAEIERALTDACGDLLEKQWLFDDYEGKGIEPGQHSLAVALQIRGQGVNLTDEQANQVRDSAVKALESLGAKLR